MICEIISVGTELLLGDILNTDTQFLSKELALMGINVLYHTTVGDNVQRLHSALNTALDRCDMIITSGGLGPTKDDLTKEVTSQHFNLPLILHKPSLDSMKEFFNSLNRPMPESNIKQAMLPEHSTVLENKFGTAPGCAFIKDNKIIIMLPGPPNELIPMFHNEVVPFLSDMTHQVIISHNIHVFGLGESSVASMLDDLMESYNPTLAPYAKAGEVMLRVTAKADTPEAADSLCTPVIDKIKKRLGNYIYGIDSGNLPNTVINLLKKSQKTLALAESCTGGLLSKQITDVPGSSDVFHCGIISYSNDIKNSILNVDNNLLSKYGAVSKEVAAAMAKGVKAISKTSYALSITGIAGPGGGSAEKPVGLVYIGLAYEDKVIVEKHNFSSLRSREYIRNSSCNYALDLLRNHII